MNWINREEQFPDLDKILCYDKSQIFICELIESKWGNHYRSTDSEHESYENMPQWTHWMPLPEPPEKK